MLRLRRHRDAGGIARQRSGKAFALRRCDADWEYRRVKCIYCGNENPNTLGALYADEMRNKLSAQTCDVCIGYVKMIAAFSPNSPEMLVVHDLATLLQDFIAQKNGCVRNGSMNR